MSTLTPPVEIGDPMNQSRVVYIHEVATAADFDYPPVSWPLIFYYFFTFCSAVWSREFRFAGCRRRFSLKKRVRNSRFEVFSNAGSGLFLVRWLTLFPTIVHSDTAVQSDKAFVSGRNVFSFYRSTAARFSCRTSSMEL